MMKNKNLAVFITAIFLLPFIVHAQSSDALPDPGITPDNPLYGLDTAFDQLSLLLTFDEAGKAKKGLEIARERLAEIRAMITKSDIHAMETADNEHKKMLQFVREETQKIKYSEASKEIEEKTKIEKQIEQHESEASEVESEIKIRMSVSGSSQKEIINSILDNLENRTSQLKTDIIQDKEKSKEKLSQERGSEDVAKAEIKLIENREGLTDVKKEKAMHAMTEASKEIAKAVSRLKNLAGIDIDYINDFTEMPPVYFNRTIINPPKPPGWPIEIVNDSYTNKIIENIQSGIVIGADAPEATRAAIASVSESIREEMDEINVTGNITKPQLKPVVSLVKNAIIHLARAKEAFDQEKYGESWGQATAAQRLASNANKILERIYESIHDSEDSGKNVTVIPFVELASGQHSPLTGPQNFVIQTQEKFDFVWNMYANASVNAAQNVTNTFSIDFNSSTVLASFMGQKNTGGYDIEVKKIVKYQGKYYVFVKYVEPATGGIVTQALSQPWTMVKTQKLDGNVLFVSRESDLPGNDDNNDDGSSDDLNDGNGLEIKINVFNNIAVVEVEKEGSRIYLNFQETNYENIVKLIADKFGISVEEVKSAVKLFAVHSDNQTGSGKDKVNIDINEGNSKNQKNKIEDSD